MGRPGKISPLKEQYAERSPYVSQETAAMLKKHLARRGINNNGGPVSMHTSSNSNLPANVHVGLGREPMIVAEGSRRLRRNSKVARLESQKRTTVKGTATPR